MGYGAQSYRPFGTAAQATVVPQALAVDLPDADLDAAVVRNGAVLAAYASPKDRPELPFWPLLFANVTIRLLGSDDFPSGEGRSRT
jgi:NADPH2:quinone reductase